MCPWPVQTGEVFITELISALAVDAESQLSLSTIFGGDLLQAEERHREWLYALCDSALEVAMAEWLAVEANGVNEADL